MINNRGSIALWVCAVLTGFFALTFPLGGAFALGDDSAPKADDEFNFQWLDPDKKIYVLQNRRYLKMERGLISVMGGPGISNAYRNTWGFGPRLGYYFSESFGLEGFYQFNSNSENGTFKSLRQATANIIPVVREITGQGGILLQYVPWYAKINVFNKILYFDWYFQAGAGALQARLDTRTNATANSVYKRETLGAMYLGTGHLFHLDHSWLMRIDFLGAFYNALDGGTSGSKQLFSSYGFGFGVGVKL